MDALSIYRRLHDAGVSVTSEDDRLLVSPAERLTDELRRLIREHKPALLQMLADARDTTSDLLAWAMKTCDHHGDSQAAREQMRRECLETPIHLRPDLLAHFKHTNGGAAA